MALIKNSKVFLKWESEKIRRKEIVKCLKRLDELTDKANDESVNDEQKEKIKLECESIIKRLKELKALKDDEHFEKIDPNVIIKTVGIGSIALIISLIEIPGNLINLRAIKIADPIIRLLKL